ncbi:MAG: hypothetical protein JWM47_4291 [Acidimicrobiales bacterium]|nr:hypothetical protein [Acidimicrobiales bacterium]
MRRANKHTIGKQTTFLYKETLQSRCFKELIKRKKRQSDTFGSRKDLYGLKYIYTLVAPNFPFNIPQCLEQHHVLEERKIDSCRSCRQWRANSIARWS